jgi:energy-coupling factor transporter ATP-binding protein EcfA2
MIARLRVINFLGVKQLQVELGKLAMFCGDNAAGKSSLQQAIRYAVTGEPTRVKLKSEYGQLVSEGSKKAEVELVMDDGEVIEVSITAAGKRSGEPNDVIEVMPYLLDHSRFAGAANASDRRELLLTLVTEPIKADKVLAKVRMQGGDVGFAEKVMPLLRSGFSAMQKACDEYAKEQRAVWKSITGETYGADKAAGWKPAKGTGQMQEVADMLQDRVRTADEAERTLNEFMREYDSIKRTLISSEVRLTCPDCGTVVSHSQEEIEQAQAAMEVAENTRQFMHNALVNAQGLVVQSQQARENVEAMLRQLEDQETRAAEAHSSVDGWAKLAELFSPDSIPKQFLEPVVEEFNSRLAWSASKTGWPQTAINGEGNVLVGNRPYPLCSESEKWRADAMIAEALSHLSGMKLLVLDRVDVLAPKHRPSLIEWCMESDAQCLLFATLKQKPEGLPAFWLERGEIVE